jgi:diaminohydroxyphosphoribosylaminopyrimidine deaminase/5-amino-6-(5-phosphoribosylamino)uracil reductase
MPYEGRHFMDEALRMAHRALGRTAPNPAVGAVVVQADRIVGRGWTHPPGGPHAEVVALAEAGACGHGATLYVTLEPCCHHGRTPPCADAIIAARIARCVVAMADPFPAVAGGGIARLRDAGVVVDVGLAADEAAYLNAGFIRRVCLGRPLVTAKYAITLDGRIATRSGHSRWITGAEARLVAHQLRDRADAVMIGAGTVIMDDPRLTTRLLDELAGDGGAHHPLRVVVDGRGTSPPCARVFDPCLPGRTLVATTEAAPPAWIGDLAARGIEHVVAGAGPLVDLDAVLTHLGCRGINNLLVEGGSRLHGAFFDAELIDRVSVFVAPTIAGGAFAPGPIGGRGIAIMAEAWRLTDVRVRQIGGDVLFEGTTVRPAPVKADQHV